MSALRLHAPSIVVALFALACVGDEAPAWFAQAGIGILTGALLVAAAELAQRYATRRRLGR